MTSSVPLFSIIVPTRDRSTLLSRCLASLARLNFPRDAFEVIVVDDGSMTPVAETISPFQREITLSLVTQSSNGPAAARNAGARHAQGVFLAFTDDDCLPTLDWLDTFQLQFDALPHSAVGGLTRNALAENIFSTASQLLIHYLHAYYNRDPDHARFFTSNNFAVPRERFLNIGGFDEAFPLAAAEDRDLCDRWLHAGNTLVYVPEAIVQHTHVLTFKGFFRQHWGYGRGAVYFHRAHAGRGQGQVKFENPGFYWGLITFPFVQHAPSAFALALLLMLSQIATVLGFISETLIHSRHAHDKIGGTR